MKSELEKHYEELKDVLAVLPTNTKANKKKKTQILEDEEKQNNNNISLTLDEIKRRISPLDSLQKNTEIEAMVNKLNTYYEDTDTKAYSSPYEKMHLDFYLYNLKVSSKENLKDVNMYLRKILKAFESAGFTLTKEDFDLSKYATEYMDFIILGKDEEALKEKFEDIYWKFPELINTIVINVQSIYIRNEKRLQKFFDEYNKKVDEALKKEDVQQNIIEYNKRLKRIVHTDPYIIFNNFKEGKWSVNTFSKNNIDSKINKYFTEGNYSFDALIDLSKILFEYYLMVKYSFLLNDMKERIGKKDEYKTSKATAIDKIEKIEKKLISLIKASNRKGIFKKNDEKWLFEYNETLKELIENYETLDNECFNDLINKVLQSDSTILEVLRLVSSHYLYFLNETLKVKEANVEEINKEFETLREDVNYKEFKMINSIALLDEKQMKEVISNKYKLEGININLDDLEEANIEKTMSDINEIIRYENILASGLKIEDIELYLEMDKITDRK